MDAGLVQSLETDIIEPSFIHNQVGVLWLHHDFDVQLDIIT